ncbi:MAG: MBL fold metallo-hydrolase [Candidatus Enteromonas sp.]
MELKFLGCGDSFCFALGNNAAFFFEGDHLYFLDMGQSIFAKALEKGLIAKAKKVTVFVTHCHLDHIGSLGEAVTYFSVFHPEIPFEIVYPNKDYLGARLGDLYPLDKVAVHEELQGTIDGVSYRFVLAKHIPSSYAIFLKDGTTYLYYSGDNATLNEEAAKLLHEGTLDALYQDVAKATFAYHFGFPDFVDAIPEGLRSKAFVMHVPSPSYLEEAKSLGFGVPDLL